MPFPGTEIYKEFNKQYDELVNEFAEPCYCSLVTYICDLKKKIKVAIKTIDNLIVTSTDEQYSELSKEDLENLRKVLE